MDAEHANINFVHFAKGSVFKTAAEANAGGASGHNATWKYAYNIAPIREWIFRQQKARTNKSHPMGGFLAAAPYRCWDRRGAGGCLQFELPAPAKRGRVGVPMKKRPPFSWEPGEGV